MISLKGLRKKAWDLQSIYVRRFAKGICFTCDIKKDWLRECDAGHYLHGDALDFELEKNIRCQCKRCNNHLSGNSGIFLSRLIKQIGYDPTDELLEKKHKIRKFTREELEGLVETYKRKITDLA